MTRNEEARSRAWRQEEQAARAIPATNQKTPVQGNGNSVRDTADDYLSPLRGERVRVVSLFGASVTGELLGIARYEIRVRQAVGGDVVILKSGIWTAEEVSR